MQRVFTRPLSSYTLPTSCRKQTRRQLCGALLRMNISYWPVAPFLELSLLTARFYGDSSQLLPQHPFKGPRGPVLERLQLTYRQDYLSF